MFQTIMVIVDDSILLHADIPTEYFGVATSLLREHYKSMYLWQTVWVGYAEYAPYSYYPTPSGQMVERSGDTKYTIREYRYPRLRHHPLVDTRTPYTY